MNDSANTPAADDPTASRLTPRRRALIVDDDATNRRLLALLLKQLEFEVSEAADGEQGLAAFERDRPDIVFMDIMMPGMDGFEACRRIKAEVGSERLLPVVFLSALDDEASLLRAMEAGGDDFLSKPYSHAVLRARIENLMRTAGLYREAASLYQELRVDEQLAEKVSRAALHTGNVESPCIRSLSESLGLFQTELLLSARAPNQDLYLLLGDFSGHRLTAAMAALPIAQIFRYRANTGFSLRQIITAVDNRLRELFAGEVDLAVWCIRIGADLSYCEVAGFAMPELYVLEADGRQVRHRQTPAPWRLGAVQAPESIITTDYLPIQPGNRLLLVSDGVTEAVRLSGEPLGPAGLERLLAEYDGAGPLPEHLYAGLRDFAGEMMVADDLSLVEIECGMELFAPLAEEGEPATRTAGSPSKQAQAEPVDCEYVWTVRGSQLAVQDPLPYVMQQLDQIEGFAARRNQFFTVLTELYVNALDHGVLALDSDLKRTPEGFARYFTLREQRLAELDTGFIQLRVATRLGPDGGWVDVTVSDSGRGYEPDTGSDGSAYAGRGLALVRELADAMELTAPGNQVRVRFLW